jgi:hypothetical protein
LAESSRRMSSSGTSAVSKPTAPRSVSGCSFQRSRPASAATSAGSGSLGLTASLFSSSSSSSHGGTSAPHAQLSLFTEPGRRSLAEFADAKRVFAQRLADADAAARLSAAARIASFAVASRQRGVFREKLRVERERNVAEAISQFRSSSRKAKLRSLLTTYLHRMYWNPSRRAAALTIQQAWRWHVARRRLQQVRTAKWSAEMALVKLEREGLACLLIQSWWRGNAAFRIVSLPRLRAERRVAGARVLQAWWRQLRALRVALELRNDVRRAECEAAVAIQTFYRRRKLFRMRIVDAVVRSILKPSTLATRCFLEQ